MTLIQTPTARQDGCGPKFSSVQRSSSQPLQSSAAELVCIGPNCFFNYRHGGNVAGCPHFEDDTHRELLIIMFHKLQTPVEE